MLQSVSSVFVVYRHKTLTGSLDPMHANSTNKPCISLAVQVFAIFNLNNIILNNINKISYILGRKPRKLIVTLIKQHQNKRTQLVHKVVASTTTQNKQHSKSINNSHCKKFQIQTNGNYNEQSYMQCLFVPFACIGSGDPVRVLCLFHNKYTGWGWSIYCWDFVQLVTTESNVLLYLSPTCVWLLCFLQESLCECSGQLHWKDSRTTLYGGLNSCSCRG